jgi:hypothetical protein
MFFFGALNIKSKSGMQPARNLKDNIYLELELKLEHVHELTGTGTGTGTGAGTGNSNSNSNNAGGSYQHHFNALLKVC